MSYCRFSDADVYMFHHYAGGILCMMCGLQEGTDALGWSTSSRREAIGHLEAHRAAGHRVPDHAFELLRAEIEQEGDEARPSREGLEDLEKLEREARRLGRGAAHRPEE